MWCLKMQYVSNGVTGGTQLNIAMRSTRYFLQWHSNDPIGESRAHWMRCGQSSHTTRLKWIPVDGLTALMEPMIMVLGVLVAA